MAAADPLLTDTKLVSDLVAAGGVNVARVCSALMLSAAEFAQLTRRATESVARLVKRNEYAQLEHPETIRVARELVQLLGLLRAMGLDAPTWIRTPMPSYAGRTPLELVRDGQGQDLVERLLGLAVGDVGG